MKIVLIFSFISVIWFLPEKISAQKLQSSESAFVKIVESILASSCLRKKKFGIKIHSLKRDKTLYSISSDRLFVPASNMKILTTALALKKLGPDYRFKTSLYATEPIDGMDLRSDIYIKGFGDPNLVSEQMWLLVNELKNLPLREIRGDIIADESFFDSYRRVKTWNKKWGVEAYNAPLGALSFNFNTVTVHVTPGRKIGDKPVVVVDPDIEFIRVTNRARTVSNSKRSRLIVNRIDRGDHNEVTISGVLSVNHLRETYYLNITKPVYYAARVFKEYLHQAGIKVTGKVRIGPIPNNAYELSSHESMPLSLILRGLNKFSNNFVAEQILKTIGAEIYNPPGTTQNGLRAMGEYMEFLKYKPEQFSILDGSGLSRKNQMSPDQIVSILQDMYIDLRVYPEFISALGVMSRDGNVLKRMNGNKDAERARVKTGTLNSISALSGYFQSADGEQFAFSMLMNGLKCSNRQAKRLQDRIITEGLNFKRLNVEPNLN
ncbi:MAG: D-alanyl-D-alanine carboxypeptidase/D-alanyl-D-alanine-endopeptidase [Nitrospina sp.]|nr:D-alanyl-D-alanine carboxypeptidase/D-alanyl-D-alanine-endopeptidase [Nitrospina sp.]